MQGFAAKEALAATQAFRREIVARGPHRYKQPLFTDIRKQVNDFNFYMLRHYVAPASLTKWSIGLVIWTVIAIVGLAQ